MTDFAYSPMFPTGTDQLSMSLSPQTMWKLSNLAANGFWSVPRG